MIAVFCAVEEELKSLIKSAVREKIPGIGVVQVYKSKIGNKNHLIVLTGMGQEKARKAAKFILDRYSISMVISTGCGGALNEEPEAGDIVVCSELICKTTPPKINKPNTALFSNKELISQAIKTLKNNNLRFRLGKGISISEVCTTPADKYKLSQEFGADMVDMESYWIGQIAKENKLPFIAARSIFDTAHDDLSILRSILTNHQVKPIKVFPYLIIHPTKVSNLLRLFHSSRKAERNLSLFIRRWIKQL